MTRRAQAKSPDGKYTFTVTVNYPVDDKAISYVAFDLYDEMGKVYIFHFTHDYPYEYAVVPDIQWSADSKTVTTEFSDQEGDGHGESVEPDIKKIGGPYQLTYNINDHLMQFKIPKDLDRMDQVPKRKSRGIPGKYSVKTD